MDENLGIVYILDNIGMPDLYKIGFTDKNDVKDRVKELSSSTSVPYPFRIYYACKVYNAQKVEDTIHKLFSAYRVNPKREFFSVDPEQVKIALSLANPVDITPDEETYIVEDELKEIEKVARQRLSNFTFFELDIPIGSTLTFLKDSNITCEVYSANTVLYKGEILSLTEASRKTGRILHKEIQGPRYWCFDDELLTSRRKRIQDY